MLYPHVKTYDNSCAPVCGATVNPEPQRTGFLSILGVRTPVRPTRGVGGLEARSIRPCLQSL
eukprot:15571734-Heterocapsa_arctica.AAC.1